MRMTGSDTRGGASAPSFFVRKKFVQIQIFFGFPIDFVQTLCYIYIREQERGSHHHDRDQEDETMMNANVYTEQYTVRGIQGEITIQVSEDFSDIDTGDAGLHAYVRGLTDEQIDYEFRMCSEAERQDIKAIVRAYDKLGGYVAYDGSFPSIVGRKGEGLKEITKDDPLWEADRAYKAAYRAEWADVED